MQNGVNMDQPRITDYRPEKRKQTSHCLKENALRTVAHGCAYKNKLYGAEAHHLMHILYICPTLGISWYNRNIKLKCGNFTS